MNLQLPNLDDRNFAELVSEALALLPRYAPEWTNHNPSDPGITLIELLAYFTEQLLYQLNRISRDTKIEFLQLLRGPDESWRVRLAQASVEEVDEELRRAVLALREPQRAVTREDFEYLARRSTADVPAEGGEKVARACCVARSNLEGYGPPDAVLPGHVSLVVVPDRPMDSPALAQLLARVRAFLAPRCLLTTRLHVVGPCYVWVSLQLAVRTASGVACGETTAQAIIARLEQRFGPYPGCGPDGEGWPFGRALHLADIASTVESLADIECVEDVQFLRLTVKERNLNDDRAALGVRIGKRSTLGVDARLGGDPAAGGGRVIRSDAGRLLGIALRSHELVQIRLSGDDLRLNGAAMPQRMDWEWSEADDEE